MGIADEDVAAVRAATDLVGLVGEHVALRQSGNRSVGLCPFHAEKTASFYVSPAFGRYHCFGCAANGDAIDFLRAVEHLDFVEAVERLAERAGITLRQTDSKAGARRVKRGDLVEVMERATEFYNHRLTSSADAGPARKYLASRGYGPETIKRFQLGWAPDDWDGLTKALGLSDTVLRDTGLGFVNKVGRRQDAFRARLMFPIFDAGGRPVAFGGRVLPGAPATEPKYKNSAESAIYSKRRVLYGLNWAKDEVSRTGEVVVCEGYTDVIALAEAGVARSVATCGTSLAEEHFELLRRFARRVVLAYDADGAGQAAAERFYELERRFELEIAVAALPAGTDPGELGQRDPAALRATVEGARTFLSFRVERLLAGADLSSAEGRARAAAAALSAVAEHPEPLVRDQYVMQIGARCRIEADQLRASLTQIRRSARPDASSRGGGRGGGGGGVRTGGSDSRSSASGRHGSGSQDSGPPASGRSDSGAASSGPTGFDSGRSARADSGSTAPVPTSSGPARSDSGPAPSDSGRSARAASGPTASGRTRSGPARSSSGPARSDSGSAPSDSGRPGRSGDAVAPGFGRRGPNEPDPGPTDPGPTDPGPTYPGPTDPGPTDPGPTDPGPTDPGPTDPGPTDPGPTDPGYERSGRYEDGGQRGTRQSASPSSWEGGPSSGTPLATRTSGSSGSSSDPQLAPARSDRPSSPPMPGESGTAGRSGTASPGQSGTAGRSGTAGSRYLELECLRLRVHRPDEVAGRLEEVCFEDPMHRAAFRALQASGTLAEAIAGAEPPVGDLLSRLAVEEADADPQVELPRLVGAAARRVLSWLSTEIRAEPSRALELAPSAGWLRQGIEALNDPATADDAAVQLLAWLRGMAPGAALSKE